MGLNPSKMWAFLFCDITKKLNKLTPSADAEVIQKTDCGELVDADSLLNHLLDM